MDITNNDSLSEGESLEIPLDLVAIKLELARVQECCSRRGLAQVGKGK